MSIYLTRRFVQPLDDFLNNRDHCVADLIFASRFRAHVPTMPTLSRVGFKNYIQSFYEAFPDLRMEIKDTIMTNDQLVLRTIYHGTHLGEFFGIPASGSEIIMPSISIFRIQHLFIVEGWLEIDLFGVMGQIRTPALTRDNHLQSVN